MQLAEQRTAVQEDLIMVNENTRRNLEQEVAGFKAQAAAGERAMKVRGLLHTIAGERYSCASDKWLILDHMYCFAG